MFKQYNLINLVCLAIAGLISAVFIYIIGTPLTEYILAASAVYFIFFVLVFLLMGNMKRRRFLFLNNKVFITGEVLILLTLIIMSVIFKELDYWNSAGIFTLGLIIIFESSTLRENLVRFLFLIISPVFYTGLILKHAYFTEVIFFCAFILLAEKLLQNKSSYFNYFIMAASLTFIMLFNPYLVLLYIIFFLHHFRFDLVKKGLPFLGVTLLLSFYIRYYFNASFFPADLNMGYAFMIPAVIVAAYAGWVVRNMKEVIFAAAIIIIAATIIKIIDGNYGAMILLFSSLYPMLILATGDYKSEKWLGKILTD